MQALTGHGSLRLRELPLDPARLWVRFVPTAWPAAGGEWVDLGADGLGRAGRVGSRVEEPEGPLSLGDVLYLPPVDPAARPARDRLAEAALAGGTPVMAQVTAGDEAPAGAVSVVDALSALIGDDPAALDGIPPSSIVLWPLVPGLTDREPVLEEGLARLGRSEAAAVVPIELRLSARQRRRFAEIGDEATFGALFHGSAASERPIARRVAAAGLEPLPGRPLPAGPPALRRNRELAGVLARCGDLWRRLGRAEERAAALLRTARWVDRSATDVTAVTREGNLGVLPGHDAWTRGLVEEWAITGGCALLGELRGEYLGEVGS